MLFRSFAEYASTALVLIAIAAVAVALPRTPVIAGATAAWLALAGIGLASIYWIGTLPISWYIENSVSRVGATILVAAATLTPALLSLALSGTIDEE